MSYLREANDQQTTSWTRVQSDSLRDLTSQFSSPCRFTTYRHRFARAAPAPRAKRNDSKNRGRASPVNLAPDLRLNLEPETSSDHGPEPSLVSAATNWLISGCLTL